MRWPVAHYTSFLVQLLFPSLNLKLQGPRPDHFFMDGDPISFTFLAMLARFSHLQRADSRFALQNKCIAGPPASSDEVRGK